MILELFWQCSILELFWQCSILELFWQCGILELFWQCSIFCFLFYYNFQKNLSQTYKNYVSVFTDYYCFVKKKLLYCVHIDDGWNKNISFWKLKIRLWMNYIYLKYFYVDVHAYNKSGYNAINEEVQDVFTTTCVISAYHY